EAVRSFLLIPVSKNVVLHGRPRLVTRLGYCPRQWRAADILPQEITSSRERQLLHVRVDLDRLESGFGQQAPYLRLIMKTEHGVHEASGVFCDVASSGVSEAAEQRISGAGYVEDDPPARDESSVHLA